jgi:hypothetical protein
VGVFAVSAGGEDHAFAVFELIQVVIERHDFRRADEGEIAGIEKQANPLAFVVFQADSAKLAVLAGFRRVVGLDGNIRGRFADLHGHGKGISGRNLRQEKRGMFSSRWLEACCGKYSARAPRNKGSAARKESRARSQRKTTADFMRGS